MPVTTAVPPPAIVQWFSIYGNIAFFFAQCAWWIVTGFAAGWAAYMFYRLANAKMKMYEAKAAGYEEADEAVEAVEAKGTAAAKSDDKGFPDRPGAKAKVEAKDTKDEAKDTKDEAKDTKDEAKDTKDKVDVDKFVD